MQTINNDAIEKADQATFNQLWKVVTEAKPEEKKAIAAIAILQSDERLRAERFAVYNMVKSKPVITANNLLHRVCINSEKVSFAIAILENITESGENNE